jgi:hypothetical protein
LVSVSEKLQGLVFGKSGVAGQDLADQAGGDRRFVVERKGERGSAGGLHAPMRPRLTRLAELEKEMGTKPASAEDFERLTAGDSSDGEG